MKAFSLLAPLVCAVYVSAHGILTNFAVNGQRQNKNVIRQVSTQDPNYGANNPALTCGPNSKPNSGIANVQPGDTLSFDWRTASGGTWPHNTGPMLTYLASCGDVTCDKFDASNARWFKVDQVGRKGNNGPWVQGDLMNGAVASMKLPSDLAPGNYLVRHEIIALHLANQIRKAEFYPGCAQLRVGGSGTGRPTNDELVRLPGAYNDNDPGLFGNFFDAGARYQFPGPKVATLVSGGNAAPPAPAGGDDDDDDNNNNNKPSGDNGNNSSTPAAPAPTKKGSKSGSCKLKKRSPVDADTLAEDNVNLFKPRHISRVMRRIAFDLSH